jgi:hypothetical protein
MIIRAIITPIAMSAEPITTTRMYSGCVTTGASAGPSEYGDGVYGTGVHGRIVGASVVGRRARLRQVPA